jgi:EmrB/QacA subfamily drug resistance transporter
MSMIQIPITLAPVFGPMFGGVIVDNLNWQWLFLVNLPIGLVGLLVAGRVLAADPPRTERPTARLDLLGVVSLPPALAALLFAFSQFGDGKGIDSPAVLTALVLGMVLLLAYTMHALRVGAAALIDLRLFANSKFGASAITAFLFGASTYGVMFLLPLYYQQAEGFDALRSGLLLAPQGVGIVLILPLVGRLTARFGARAVVISGMVIAVLGTVPYVTMGTDTGTAFLIGSLVVRGIGLGTTLAPALSSAFSVTAPESASRASSALITAIQLGGSVGTALLAVILQQQLSGSLGASAVHTTVADNPQLALPLTLAFGHTFWWALSLCVLGALVAVFLPGRERAHAEHG